MTRATTRSAWWAAITLSGTAVSSALNTVSTMVIGKVIHQRIGAGFWALTTLPGGRMIFSGRNEPSLIG